MNDLKWKSLETRRNNQQLSMFCRMQHNMVSVTSADHFVPFQRSYSRRSVMTKCVNCQVPYARTIVYKYSFFPATVRVWNTLPSSLIHCRFSFLKQASVFITNTDSHDHRPQCVKLGFSRDALYWNMRCSCRPIVYICDPVDCIDHH